MRLILCSDGDTTATWAYAHLRKLGCADLELVTSEDLALATQWSHRVQSDGSALDIKLKDGRCLAHASVDGVINRLNWPSRALVAQAAPEDQDYAYSELFAFYLSWLHSLPGKVFNRATPQGLSGSWRPPAQWALLAGQSGFTVAPYTESDTAWERPLPEGRTLTQIVVFEGKPFGAIETKDIEPQCRELFARSKTSLLGLDLYRSEQGRWIFYNATTLPDLCVGGIPLLEEILKTWSLQARSNEVTQ
jgi:hypothetical protein